MTLCSLPLILWSLCSFLTYSKAWGLVIVKVNNSIVYTTLYVCMYVLRGSLLFCLALNFIVL